MTENAHEVWAANRPDRGLDVWSLQGRHPEADPDMVSYSKQNDSEKYYDREMAMNTLKLLKKLGYDIVKRNKKTL